MFYVFLLFVGELVEGERVVVHYCEEAQSGCLQGTLTLAFWLHFGFVFNSLKVLLLFLEMKLALNMSFIQYVIPQPLT